MRKTSIRMCVLGLVLFLSLIMSKHDVFASEYSDQNPISSDQATDLPPQNADLGDEPENPGAEILHIAVIAEKTDPEEGIVTLAWEPLSGASEYVVMHRDESEWVTVSRSADCRASVSVEEAGTADIYKICVYDAEGVLLGESDELELLIPKKVTNLCTTALSKTKVRLYWDVSDGARAYQVYVRTGKGSYKLAQTVENQKVRLTVKENEKYYFRIVPIYTSQIGIMEGNATQITFTNQNMVLPDHQKYTYEEMCTDIKDLCKKYSEYVSYETIGKSEQGRDIYDVILGNPKAKNTILVVSTLHGREYIATAVCMKQLEYYLQNYNKTVDGKKLSEVFDNCNVHYVMMANPDGVTISQTSDARWKGNANGVNLNNNFPYAFRSEGSVKNNNYSGEKAASESETQAIIALTKKLNKTQNLAVVNYHAMGHIVYGDYSGKNDALKEDIKQMYQIARDTTGYASAGGSGGRSHGNYREYLSYRLEVPSITLEVGSVPCPVPQYQYASEFKKNKLVVLREAAWLSGQ